MKREEYRKEDTVPFFPHHIISEVIVVYIVLALLIILASTFPAGLEEKADPFSTPLHIKPEWYFLAVYQLLKVVPKIIGILLPPIGLLVIALLPFWDRSPVRHPRKRPVAMIAMGLLVIWLLVFTYWGMVS